MDDLFREYNGLGGYNGLGAALLGGNKEGMDLSQRTSTTPSKVSERESTVSNDDIMDVVCTIFSTLQSMNKSMSKQLEAMDQRMSAIEEKLNSATHTPPKPMMTAAAGMIPVGSPAATTAGATAAQPIVVDTTTAPAPSNGEEASAIRPGDSFEEVCNKLAQRGWTIDMKRSTFFQPSLGYHNMMNHKHLIGDKYFLGRAMLMNYLKNTFHWTPPNAVTAPVVRAPIPIAPATTAAPVVRAPVAIAPVAAAPRVVRAPVVRAQYIRAPVAAAAPVARVPVAMAPVGRAPVGRAPVAIAPIAAPAPVIRAPVAAAPVPIQRGVNIDTANWALPKPNNTPLPDQRGTVGNGSTHSTIAPDSSPPPSKIRRVSSDKESSGKEFEWMAILDEAIASTEPPYAKSKDLNILPKQKPLFRVVNKGNNNNNNNNNSTHNHSTPTITKPKVKAKPITVAPKPKPKQLSPSVSNKKINKEVGPMSATATGPLAAFETKQFQQIQFNSEEEKEFYSYRNLMPKLERLGWSYQKGHRWNDWVYVLPGSKGEKGGEHNVDFFYTWWKVVAKCREWEYFERRVSLGLVEYPLSGTEIPCFGTVDGDCISFRSEEERRFYDFVNLMPQLKSKFCWGYRQSDPSKDKQHAWNHIRPGRRDEAEGGIEGVDYFDRWSKVVRHLMAMDFYGQRKTLGLVVGEVSPKKAGGVKRTARLLSSSRDVPAVPDRCNS